MAQKHIEKAEEHLLQEYMTVPQFARLKGVSRNAIRDAIDAGRIIVSVVGIEKDLYINTVTNGDVKFAPNVNRKNNG